MFQSFESKSDPSTAAARVASLREAMRKDGVDVVMVPRADEHQGEYVAPSSERLAWITSFTGSAGAALILRDKAVLFVDGRYTVQAAEQTDPAIFAVDDLVGNPPREWLRQNISVGAHVGFDPWLHTIADARALRDAMKQAEAELVPLGENLIDRVWTNRPEAPLGAVKIHPLTYAGVSAEDKIATMRNDLAAAKLDYTILTDPSSIAWAFNIRGSDVPHTPLALSFAVMPAKAGIKPLLFIDSRKLNEATRSYLEALATLHAPETLEEEIRKLAEAGTVFGLDEALAAEKFRLIIEDAGGTFKAFADPAALPRARKNAVELEGARNAHRRDGAAVCAFLAWIDAQDHGTLTEIKVVEQLEAIRTEAGQLRQMPLRDISFGTICGSGPNAALPHYRVDAASNRAVGSPELLLVDSGGQYEDGTTDITRTVAIGTPTEEMRQRFTLVLKGMIAISLMRFPSGTRGMDIDAIARMAMWRAGLDYGHGTGHGVGSYLSVHEGPQRIAKSGTAKLEPSMILSNEPGYYKPGHYGIRIENLIIVTEAEAIAGGDIAMHAFETLTLVPIDTRLIDAAILTEEERAWLNAYHAHVFAQISPLVDAQTLSWLEQATIAV